MLSCDSAPVISQQNVFLGGVHIPIELRFGTEGLNKVSATAEQLPEQPIVRLWQWPLTLP